MDKKKWQETIDWINNPDDYDENLDSLPVETARYWPLVIGFIFILCITGYALWKDMDSAKINTKPEQVLAEMIKRAADPKDPEVAIYEKPNENCEVKLYNGRIYQICHNVVVYEERHFWPVSILKDKYLFVARDYVTGERKSQYIVQLFVGELDRGSKPILVQKMISDLPPENANPGSIEFLSFGYMKPEYRQKRQWQ